MGGFFDKYKITFIYILSLIVVAGVSIIIIFTTKEDKKNMNKSIYQKNQNQITLKMLKKF